MLLFLFVVHICFCVMSHTYKSLFFDLDDTLCTFTPGTGKSHVPVGCLLMPHAYETLSWLSGRYRLYVLSNGTRESQIAKLQETGIVVFFRQVIVSEDIGVGKPHAPIFHFALSVTQSQVGDALMIGDSWEKDVEGAASIGMHQVYYNVEGRQTLPFRPTYHITDLKELIEIL